MQKSLLIKNSTINLVGLGAPLLVALFSIPQLLDLLGQSKFGLLALIWAIVSYFGFFDLGVSRALTIQLSAQISAKKHELYKNTISTSTYLLLGLSVASTLLLILITPWLSNILADDVLREDFKYSLYMMAVATPAIIFTTGIKGVLEANQAFIQINAIRIPMGIFTFVAPLVCIASGYKSLFSIAVVLVIGRFVFLFIHYILSRKFIAFSSELKFDQINARELIRVGGWITTSNVINPIVGYLDRFIISAILGSSAVALYVTPNEIVTKIWIIPAALTAVLFPMVPGGMGNVALLKDLSISSTRIIFLTIFPFVLVLFNFSHELMRLWISEEFANQSHVLLQMFSLGILINGLAQVPFTIIQGTGNAKTSALIHISMLPIYALGLFLLISEYGLVGAGVCWLIRIIIDSSLMMYFSHKIIHQDIIKNIDFPIKHLFISMAFLGAIIVNLEIKIIWSTIFIALAAYYLFSEVSGGLSEGK